MPRETGNLKSLAPWWLAAVCAAPLLHPNSIFIDFGPVSVRSGFVELFVYQRSDRVAELWRLEEATQAAAVFFLKDDKSRRLIVPIRKRKKAGSQSATMNIIKKISGEIAG